MKIEADEVKHLTEKAAKALLRKIIKQLDMLDEEDYFGTQGWRYYLGVDD